MSLPGIQIGQHKVRNNEVGIDLQRLLEFSHGIIKLELVKIHHAGLDVNTIETYSSWGFGRLLKLGQSFAEPSLNVIKFSQVVMHASGLRI